MVAKEETITDTPRAIARHVAETHGQTSENYVAWPRSALVALIEDQAERILWLEKNLSHFGRAIDELTTKEHRHQ